MELYFDGSLVTPLPHSNNWREVDHITIPANTQVIAVQGTNNELVAGILASSADRTIMTNSSWRCLPGSRHEPAPAGWKDTGFDDSAWPAAVTSWRNVEAPWWGSMWAISSEASWIWTNFPPGSDGWQERVYCRLSLCTRC
jgi:hypothetical protein